MGEAKFKGKTVKVHGSLPKVGEKAPDFHLVDQDLSDRSLADFRGKRKLIAVAPSLDTSVCLASAKKFNEMAKNNPSIMILFVSADLPFAQKRICGLEKLDNIKTLSMMRDKEFGMEYGLLIEEGPLKGLLARAVLILDENDTITYLKQVTEITEEPDYEEALKALS